MNQCDNSTESASWRERKARARRATIHAAAVDLALADGVDAVTVASIAEVAGISARTFFNYYATKEDAIVGVDPEGLPESQIEEFVTAEPTSEDVLVDVARLIFHGYVDQYKNDETGRKRRELFAKHPELFRHKFERNLRMEQQAAEAVRRRLDHWGVSFPGIDQDAAASMLVNIAVAPIRQVSRRLAGATEARVDATTAEELFDDVIETFRTIVRCTDPAAAVYPPVPATVPGGEA